MIMIIDYKNYYQRNILGNAFKQMVVVSQLYLLNANKLNSLFHSKTHIVSILNCIAIFIIINQYFLIVTIFLSFSFVTFMCFIK